MFSRNPYLANLLIKCDVSINMSRYAGVSKIFLQHTYFQGTTQRCAPLKQGNKPRKRESQNSVNGASGPIDRQRDILGHQLCRVTICPDLCRTEGILVFLMK